MNRRVLPVLMTMLFLFALVVAALYWVLVNKTRFGFRLRASGLNPVAASIITSR